jgi:hypothetical protein
MYFIEEFGGISSSASHHLFDISGTEIEKMRHIIDHIQQSSSVLFFSNSSIETPIICPLVPERFVDLTDSLI